MVSAFAVHRSAGLALIKRPLSVSGHRRFYMNLEHPHQVCRGEQVGLRVNVFNFWDQWLEALVELKPTNQFQAVKVNGKRALQTLVYLEAGESKQLHFPIVALRDNTCLLYTSDAADE